MHTENILVARSLYEKAKCLAFKDNGSLGWSSNPSEYLAFDTKEEAVSYLQTLDNYPPSEIAEISVIHKVDGIVQANLAS